MSGWNDARRLNHQASGAGSKEERYEYIICKSCEVIL